MFSTLSGHKRVLARLNPEVNMNGLITTYGSKYTPFTAYTKLSWAYIKYRDLIMRGISVHIDTEYMKKVDGEPYVMVPIEWLELIIH